MDDPDLDLRRGPETVAMQRLPGVGAPRSYDSDTHEVDLVASTDRPIRIAPLFAPERDEVLLHTPEAVDMTRIDAGRMPLLLDHMNSTSAVVGRIVSGRLEGGQLVLRARIDRTDIRERVQSGNLSSISVGYRPLRVKKTRSATRDRPAQVEIDRWEPVEASLVAVPADAGAHVRSLSNPPAGGDPMAHENDAGAPPATEETRSRAPSHLAAVDDDPAQIRRDVTAIARLCRMHDIPAKVSDRLMEDGDLTVARNVVADIREQRDRQTVIGRMYQGYDAYAPDNQAKAMTDALVGRILDKPAEGPGRDYMSMSLPQMARAMTPGAQGLDDRRVMEAAIQTRAAIGLHTTSDFPAILDGALRNSLMAQYQALRNPILQAGRRRDAPDLRLQERSRLHGFPPLRQVNEHAEYTFDTIAESQEKWRVQKYGRRFGITLELMINDNLNAFSDLTSAAATEAASLEGDIVADLLAENSGTGPTLVSDGVVVFHSDHGNLGTAGAISMTTLTEARLLLRSMKDANGRRILVTPKFLIVPPDLETAGEQVLAEVNGAHDIGDVNPFAGKLTLLVEPRLSDVSTTAYYVASSDLPMLEYGNLDGQRGPVVETRNGWEIDGLEIKIRHFFGAGMVDYRGWVRNAGG